MISLWIWLYQNLGDTAVIYWALLRPNYLEKMYSYYLQITHLLKVFWTSGLTRWGLKIIRFFWHLAWSWRSIKCKSDTAGTLKKLFLGIKHPLWVFEKLFVNFVTFSSDILGWISEVNCYKAFFNLHTY